MDPAEAIFKRVARLWTRLTGTPFRDRAPEGAVTLASMRDRAEVLAALLTGRAIEVRTAHDHLGGIAGDSLFLPRFAASAEHYRVRIAFSCTAAELGLHATSALDRPHEVALATLLAVPTVRARLTDAYPAAAARERELSLAEYRQRPPVGDPGSIRGALEAWARALAGAPREVELPREIETILAETCELRFERPADHLEATEELSRALERVTSGRREPPMGNPLWGRLMPRSDRARAEVVDEAPGGFTAGAGERRVIELDRAIRMKRAAHRRREDKPLYHMFEKVETAEEYAGESGSPESDGDVREMEEALSELSLGQVIRTTDDPRNLVRADVIMDPNELDVLSPSAPSAARSHRYPEWDHRKGRYLEGHCTVVEERFEIADHADAAAQGRSIRGERRQVDSLRMHVMRSLYRRRARNRQLDGPEIDVEAIVERHADRIAGSTPTERLYIAPRRALREVSILVLVDTSFSTDAWLDGRRVLDVELESLLVIAEAFGGLLEEEVAVASFRSHTRHDVRFGFLKSFRDDWAALRRVSPFVEPGGYTRIGAALRHATSVLEAERSRRKLLLLISDGKPTDYDRYEGRYGVEDVRKAVLEAGQRDVQIFGLAVEKEAKLHLARMLGRGRYRILPRPSLLPDAMAEVFAATLFG